MDETNNQGTNASIQQAAPEVNPSMPEPAAPQVPANQQLDILPEDARNRTRDQFEKLLESNRRLHEQNQLLARENETRRQSVQSTAPQQQPQSTDPNDFVERNPITGEAYINEQRLRARLAELEARSQRVNQLEQTVQGYMKTAEEREIERQERETYQAYPQLNASDPKGFDMEFNRNVRSVLTDSFYNSADYGGRPLSFKEAADFVSARTPKPAQQPIVDEAAANAQAAATVAAQTAKEQGSASAVSQPRAQAEISDEEELNDLRYKTRYLNDDWALARRIVNTDHVVRDEPAS